MPVIMYHRCFFHYYEGRFSELHLRDISFKMACKSHNFGGKKAPTFFTKSMSKSNFKQKYQFLQGNPTGAPKLTLWPFYKDTTLLRTGLFSPYTCINLDKSVYIDLLFPV